jgi:hypothetical protein
VQQVDNRFLGRVLVQHRLHLSDVDVADTEVSKENNHELTAKPPRIWKNYVT